MIFANVISYILVIVGGLNWGLYGIFNFNLVSWIFQGPRSVGSIIVYVLITLAAVWLIISPMITGYGLKLMSKKNKHSEERREKRSGACIIQSETNPPPKGGLIYFIFDIFFFLPYCKIKNCRLE